MKHAFIIKQVFRVVREIEVQVEAPDRESAREELESGNLDGPSFEDPDWLTGWDLQNEEIIDRP